ncbi:MAG: acetate--CoA ligase family protein [Thermoplasmatota archaeon]
MGEQSCFLPDLERFFKPRGVAVIGASSNPSKLGYKLVRNISAGGYHGGLYPVNIKGDDVAGIRSYRGLEEIEGPVDLALISLPWHLVKGSLEEIGRKGIPFAIIVSAGFREVGNVKGELELVEVAGKYGVRILGPNVFGMIYTPVGLNAQFGPGDVMKGRVAIITQSGALGAALMGKVFEEGIGVSGVVSTGNKADISDEELLQFFCSDPNTDAVLMYVEGLKDGRAFMDIVSSVSTVKPIIVVKSGTTEEGARAVRSHTASLAGSDRVFDGAFKQAGVLRAPTIKDAIDWTRTLIDLPLPKKREVLIITNGGGLGAIAVDWLTKNDIPLFKDMEWIEREMGPIFPSYATMDNPVDITAQVPWEVYLLGLKRALEDDEIGSVMGIYAPTSGADVGAFTRGMIETIGKPGKPVVIVTFGGSSSMEQIQELKKHGIPAFYYPEEAVSSLATLYRYAELAGSKYGDEAVDVSHRSDDPGEILKEMGPGFVPVDIGLDMLEKGKFNTAGRFILKDEGDIPEAVTRIGFPMVLKAVDRELVHKTEKGGVITGISNEKELRMHYRSLSQISGRVMAMEQVKGTELIIGGIRDPVFGPVVMFGLGGVMVEALEDIVFRVAPLSRSEAVGMISSIRGIELLRGFRNAPRVDIGELSGLLMSLGDLLIRNPGIAEIEINPLFATDWGLIAVDSRIRLD